MKNSTIGERIKELRCEKGLSQLEFSNKLNVSNTTLSMYESNKRIPSDDIKEKIANYFDVSIDYLMCRTNQRNTGSKEQLDHDEFMENVKVQFMDASEKDRDAIYRKISELYWDAKEKYDNQNK